MEAAREYKGKIPPPGTVPKLPQSIFNMEREKPKRRILRRFVQRGGQLVEVESVVRETR